MMVFVMVIKAQKNQKIFKSFMLSTELQLLEKRLEDVFLWELFVFPLDTMKSTFIKLVKSAILSSRLLMNYFLPVMLLFLLLPAQPLRFYLQKKSLYKLILTINLQFFANLIGAPALSLPFSFSKDNMPIGIQLMSSAFNEQKILDIAFSLEKDLNTHKKRAYNG